MSDSARSIRLGPGWLALWAGWLAVVGCAGPRHATPALVTCPPAVSALPCADDCCRGLRDFWIVDARDAPTCGDLLRGTGALRYWHREDGTWKGRGLDEFLKAVDSSLPTTLLVHGNMLDRQQAVDAAQMLIRGIGEGAPPFRLVLWSWPAEHIRGVSVPDNIREKARRCEVQGYYLAWLVDQIDPAVGLSLTGHSFGARTVTAALDGLATGQVAGRDLPPRTNPQPRPMQAALVAAAMDADWLYPGNKHGLAWTQVDRMLITYNRGDIVLRVFTRLSGRPIHALGTAGLTEPWRLGEDRSKLVQLPARSLVGCFHLWSRYAQRPESAARLQPYFIYPVEALPAADDIAGPAPVPASF